MPSRNRGLMTALAPGRIENDRHPASFSERPHLADELVARHSEGMSVENGPMGKCSIGKLASGGRAGL
jgi:hypothetical protein